MIDLVMFIVVSIPLLVVGLVQYGLSGKVDTKSLTDLKDVIRSIK